LLRANGILLVSGAYNPEGPKSWLELSIGTIFGGSSSKSKRSYEACPTVGDELQFSILRPGRAVDWIIGAIRFEFGRQDSFVVLLKKEMWSTSIEIGFPLIGEALEDIALSYNIGHSGPKSIGESRRRQWKNESDQLLWNLPTRSESILVTTRKQIVSGESTNVITVDLIK
jgi:hypothetical protein